MTIQNVRSMLDGRGLWIDLLGQIFSSLPPVPEGYPSDAYLKANPRPNREMIVLDKIESAYYPDLLGSSPLTTPPPELGPIPTAASATPGAVPAVTDPALPPGCRGFVITLSITTPHSYGYQYVLETMVPNLKKYDMTAMTKWNTDNPSLPRNFYIAKVSAPMQRVQIKDDSARMQMLQTSYNDVQSLLGNKPGDQSAQPTAAPPPYYGGGYNRAGGYGGPPNGGRSPYYGGQPVYAPPAPVAGAASNIDPGVFMDRLTNEDRRDDWEMKVMLIVVIDPPPAVPTATQ
jgi:hypothetical protein